MYEVMRSGNSGRIEKYLEALSVWFHTGMSPGYARKLLIVQLEKELEWTDEMQYIWYNSCPMNPSGKKRKGKVERRWVAIDEYTQGTRHPSDRNYMQSSSTSTAPSRSLQALFSPLLP